MYTYPAIWVQVLLANRALSPEVAFYPRHCWGLAKAKPSASLLNYDHELSRPENYHVHAKRRVMYGEGGELLHPWSAPAVEFAGRFRFRIDAVKHVRSELLKSLADQLQSKDPLTASEAARILAAIGFKNARGSATTLASGLFSQLPRCSITWSYVHLRSIFLQMRLRLEAVKPCRTLLGMMNGINLRFRTTLLLLICNVATGQTARTQTTRADYLVPFPPHHVVGNVYFVGSKALGIYLVTSPQGHILINSGLEESVPLIQQSIDKLGFRFADIKILLISHAHFDHDAGAARIKQLTGAKYMVMDADVPVVESGGAKDFFYGRDPRMLYPAAKVDRVLHDGDVVSLGGSGVTAHLTPGHTKGCTTWTMKVEESGKHYDVVIVGSPNVNDGYRLVNNPTYPEIASDYQKMFGVLRSLPCDIFLGAHGNYYDMETKYAHLKDGGLNPFIDPDGYKRYINEREQTFRAELARQQQGAR